MEKRHYKMYKKGKQWMIGGIITAALTFGATTVVTSTSAYADDTSDATSAVTSSTPDSTSTAASSAATTSATTDSSSASSASSSAATTATGTSVTDDTTNSTDVTLGHGDNSTRNVTVSVPVNEGDTVTVSVPYIFSASTDQDTTGEYYTVSTSTQAVADPGYDTSKSLANTTFTYTMSGSRSVEFNVKLTPTVSDWSFLTPGSQFQVIVKKNGEDVGNVTYTIADPATITSTNISLDQNQTTNLAVGQKYAVGINLANNGTNDGDNFAGTTVVNVPDGWQLDTASYAAYGLNSSTAVGDTITTFNDLTNGNVTLSQDGGAGTPVTISFNTAKSSLNNDEIILWGTYTKELSANDNTFSATTTYYSTNSSDEKATNGTLTAQGTQNLGLPVTSNENASLQAEFTPTSGDIFTDNGTADGTHQSDDIQYDYQDGRTIVVNNNGNVEQTNVNIHLDLEPGTVLNGGNGSYSLAFQTTSENQPGVITVTTTDGKTYTSSPVYVTSNNNSWIWTIDDDAIAAGVAKDGSNIASLDISYKKDISYKNIEAGTSLKISFANNSILSAATSKKAGDTASYQYKVTSDQDTAGQTGSMDLKIADPTNKAVSFTGQVENQPSGSYQPTSTDGGNTATIVYNFRNSATANDSSSYLVTIPEGFDVTDTSQLHLYQNNQEYTDGTIEDLGYVGVNGERMFKVTLGTTPSYQSPIYLKGSSADTPITIVANEDQLPASYSYRNGDTSNGTAMSLIMAINDQDQFSNNSWDEETLTLKDGSTYNVVLSQTGWYANYTEASYNFTYPSTYGQLNGIKSSADNKYTTSSRQAVSLNYSDNNNVSNTTGTIRLTNILTDKSTSSYSNNIINLPGVENGDSATLQLTGPATETTTNGNVADVEVLYSTSYVTDPTDTSSFVSADQITDWSQIKSVILKSGAMEPSAVAATYLPFEVTALADGVNNTTVNLPEYFAGDHSGVTYTVNSSLKVNVQRYVDVTTNWVTQADDGSQTAIKTPTTETVQSDSAYTTSGLATSEIPANYHLLETPSNATGTTGSSNVNVTYVYVADTTTTPANKTVSQQVVYTGAGDATPSTNTQSTSFTGTTTTNEVTGSSTTDWNEDSHTFNNVATPVVAGYYADQASVDGATVTPTSDDVTTTVTYKQLGSIVPVDENGNEISTPVTYNNDSNDPTKAATTDTPTVPGWTTTTTSVDPTNPGEDTRVVYTHATSESDVNKQVNQTVNYTGAGDNTPATNTQTADFTGTATTDQVTGQTTTAWNEDSHTFNNVATPVVAGYYADQASVDGATVTPTSDDVTTTVTYKQLGSIVPVDENGNEISTPVTYNNDSNDPTKAATTDTPTVPGWITTTTSVDPANPGEDTKVVYTPIVLPSPSNDSKENPQDDSYLKTITDYTLHTINSSSTDDDLLITTNENSYQTNQTTTETETTTLPQTGNDQTDNEALAGLGLAFGTALIGLLGFGNRKQKRN